MCKASALKKVFFMSEELLPKDADDGHLRLEMFFHPGHGKEALFITHPDGRMMELVAFTEPRRSWFVDSEVCSNGRIYMTAPVDPTFLALHHLRKHCAQSKILSFAFDGILYYCILENL